jgi:hydroxyethylthiazole kinase-like uncharacterized protein yjeF
MIRYVGPDDVCKLVIENRPEVVLGHGKADAIVVGSGVPVQSVDQRDRVLTALQDGGPAIIDAGALAFVDWSGLEPMSAILTPHAGELARLLDSLGRHLELDYEAAALAAALTGQVVVLKGNTTLIAEPNGDVVAVGPNSTALATAGTGDVLAGIMGALLASNVGKDLVEVAELAIRLHSEAANRAAAAGPVVAMDVVNSLREVVLQWQEA